MKPTISIIILNWDGKKMTEGCLNSIMPQVNKNFEIIVVDNGSTDGSAKYIKNKFPSVNIIESPVNLGYAGGNNLGVQSVKGNYVLILNNDVIVDKNFLYEIWKNKDKADILGVKNYYYDNKNILWSVGSRVNKFTLKACLIGNKEEDVERYDKNFTPPQVTGSAMLINKKVIDKIGFLDENYFTYYEETEWQTRARNTGFRISWIPTAKLWHKVGFSTGGGRSPMSAYYLVRNRGYYIKKYGRWNIIAWLYWLFEVKMRIFYGLIKNREYAKMSWKGMIDFFKGKKGKLV